MTSFLCEGGEGGGSLGRFAWRYVFESTGRSFDENERDCLGSFSTGFRLMGKRSDISIKLLPLTNNRTTLLPLPFVLRTLYSSSIGITCYL